MVRRIFYYIKLFLLLHFKIIFCIKVENETILHIPILGDPCASNEDCLNFYITDHNLICLKNRCECSKNFKWDPNQSNCVNSNNCNLNSDCNVQQKCDPVKKKCICNDGYKEQSLSKECKPLDVCESNSDCLNPFICLHGKCDCYPLYNYNNITNKCENIIIYNDADSSTNLKGLYILVLLPFIMLYLGCHIFRNEKKFYTIPFNRRRNNGDDIALETYSSPPPEYPTSPPEYVWPPPYSSAPPPYSEVVTNTNRY